MASARARPWSFLVEGEDKIALRISSNRTLWTLFGSNETKYNRMNLYNLSYHKPNGEEVSLSDYTGRPVLIVNTATQCALTPQFTALEELHQEYGEEGLVVLGFPCNQFLNQEPLSNDEMESSCQINYGVTFQLTQKVKVNGKDEHPVFSFLKKHLGGGLLGSDIKWNFTKFLIDGNGKPHKRYAPTTKPTKIRKDIIKLLKKSKKHPVTH